MISIIAASRLRGQAQPEANTFLGGVFSESSCATRLGVNVSEIKGHQILNGQTTFRIDVNYTLVNLAFRGEELLFYVDLQGKCIGINTERALASDFDVSLFYFPNVQNVGDLTFLGRRFINHLALSNVVNLGSTAGNNAVFTDQGGFPREIYVNQTQETVNSGSPDGDIVFTEGRGSNILYIQNYTKPTAPTISANTIGGTYVELNVSQPTHVNTLKYALVFVDGFFQDIYDIDSNIYALNLEEQTSYNIKVIIADEYFNISPYSNTINVTTTTIDTTALFQNAVAYYKLDETSGNAIDVVNGFDGTLFGGVTQSVSGKIGTAYQFDGIDGRVDLSPSIYNNFDNDNYTVSFWFSTNDNTKTQILISDFDGSNFPDRKLFAFINGVNQNLVFAFGDDGNNKTITSSVISNNTFYFVQLKYNISGVAELKLNNVSQGTRILVNAPQNQNLITLGDRKTFPSSFVLDGVIDELSFINGQTTAAQDSDLYNNGTGTTI